MKTCSKCSVPKELTEFRVDCGRPRASCRKCEAKWQRDNRIEDPEGCREKTRAWRKKNPHKVAAQHRKNQYGITEVQYQALLSSQNHKCAICGDPFKSTYSTHLDHCHKTKKIRGILCVTCNTGLGKFSDCPTLLQKALEYLKRFL